MTRIYHGQTVHDPESAGYVRTKDEINPVVASGGGFSNVYRRPDYQDQVVQAYFSRHNPPYAYYSALADNAPNPVTPNVTALAGETGGV